MRAGCWPAAAMMPTGSDALKDKGIRARIPGPASRARPVARDGRRTRRRDRIEILFGRLKDWRGGAPRCDRCPGVVLATVALVVTVMLRP